MKKLFICAIILFFSSFVFADSNEEIISKFLQNGTYVKYYSHNYNGDIVYINKYSILSIELQGKRVHIVSNGGKFITSGNMYLYIDLSNFFFALDEYNNLIIDRK